MSLPSSVGLKSKYNGNYLRFIAGDTKVHGFLQFSGEELVTPYSKFQVEVAKSGNGFVHIRSVYNNKYWARWSEHHWWIVAGADEPNEDQSTWSCTLFEPLPVDNDPNVIRLRHVQLGHYACLWRIAAPFTSCLFAAGPNYDKDYCDVFTVINFETLFILPKHITFKGDNGSYLSGKEIEKHPYLQFSSNNVKDTTVWYEAFITNDGSARIKSDYFAKFWRRSPNWIWADSDDAITTNLDTLFWPTEVEKTVVALRNLGNNYYCKRLTAEGKTSCLNAGISTITTEAMLQLEEIVDSRLIYDVEYCQSDARIYDKMKIVLATVVGTNNGDEPEQLTFNISYMNSVTTTWNSTISRKLFSKVRIEAKIPTISGGNIESSDSISQEYDWGEPITTTNQMTVSYTTEVPAKTAVKVSLVAIKGSFDIPFTYTQKDTLLNGNQIASNFDDGLFTGTEFLDITYETKFVPIVE